MSNVRFIKLEDSVKKEKNVLKEIEGIVKRETKVNRNILVGKKFIKALISASRTIYGDKYALKQSVLSPEMVERVLALRAIKPLKQEVAKKKFKIDRVLKSKKKEEKIGLEQPKKEVRDLLVKDHKILARSYLEREDGRLTYILLEPDVNLAVLEIFKKDVKDKIEKDSNKAEDNEFLSKELKKVYKKVKFEYNERDLLNLKYYLYRDLIKYGKIDPLFYDEKVNSIVFDSGNVKVEFGNDKIDTNIKLEKEEVNELFEKFAKLSGKKLNEKDPILTGNIGKFKLHATYSKNNSKFVLER